MERFAKVVHTKMKQNNIFNDTSDKILGKWASIFAANFQLGSVSPVKVSSKRNNTFGGPTVFPGNPPEFSFQLRARKGLRPKIAAIISIK